MEEKTNFLKLTESNIKRTLLLVTNASPEGTERSIKHAVNFSEGEESYQQTFRFSLRQTYSHFIK